MNAYNLHSIYLEVIENMFNGEDLMFDMEIMNDMTLTFMI